MLIGRFLVTWNVQGNVNGISSITVSSKELMNYFAFHLLVPLLRLHLMVTFVY